MPWSTVRRIVASCSRDSCSACCAMLRSVTELRWFAIVRIEVAQARAQLLPLAHVAGGAENEAQLPVLSENLRAVDLEPCVRAVATAQPDRDGVDVRAGVQPLARSGGDTEIVGVDQI